MNNGTAKKIRQALIPAEQLNTLKESNGGKRVSRGHFLRSMTRYEVVKAGQKHEVRLVEGPRTAIKRAKIRYKELNAR